MIDNYQILGTLYKSDKTEILLGENKAAGHKVIIKSKKGLKSGPSTTYSLQNEFEIYKKIKEEDEIADYKITSTGNYFIRTYIEGITLADYLDSTQSDIEEKLKLSVSLVKAVKQLHTKNITHKDIHPANIIINEVTKEVTIIDFTLSSSINLKSHFLGNPSKIEGSLYHCSPERTGRMNREVDYRSDLYSLGVILYQLFSGKLPFDSTNPLKLIYTHIAKLPKALKTLNENISPVISDIVEKLLAKSPEDRYQSINSLIIDFEKCLKFIKSGKKIEYFPIAQNDNSWTFNIPEKLYGKDKAREQLISALEKVVLGRKLFVSIEGKSGVGKSTLVYDMQKEFSSSNAFFINGKFDLSKQNIPFYGWLESFNLLLDILLTENDDQLNYWKERIKSKVQDDIELLIKFIPSIQLIIPNNPNNEIHFGQELLTRFNTAIKNFIAAITSDRHPLVIFMEDFQWADDASLKLLESLFTEPGISHLLIITSLRSSDVLAVQKFLNQFNEIENIWRELNDTDLSITYAPDKKLSERIWLENLSIEDVSELLKDMFYLDYAEIAELSSIIHAKTLGNNFFINQFLKLLFEKKFIKLDGVGINAKWTFELDLIKNLDIAEDVAEILKRKCKDLPHETLILLQHASCLGYKFKLDDLRLIHTSKNHKLEQLLNFAIKEGLLVPTNVDYRFLSKLQNVQELGGSFQFVHNKVREVIDASLNQGQKRSLHYQIAEMQLSTFDEGRLEENIFNVANHLNQAAELVEDIGLLNRINYKAGKKAKSSIAFEQSYVFFDKVKQNLPVNSWKDDYKGTLTFYNELAEAAFLSGNYYKLDEITDTILSKSSNNIDKAKALVLQTNALFIQQDHLGSVESGLKALQLFNIRFKINPKQFDIILEHAKTKFLLRSKDPEGLLKSPLIVDKEKDAVLRILATIAPPSFFTNPLLFPLILYKMVQISSRFGINSTSPYGFAAYGFVLSGITGEVRLGAKFGQLALDLIKKHQFDEFIPRTLFTVHFFIEHWLKGTKSTIHDQLVAYRKSIKSGDIDFTGFLGNGYSQCALMSGYDLDEMEEFLRIQNQNLTRTKVYTSLTFNQIYLQFTLCLLDKAENSGVLKGVFYDAVKQTEKLIETKNNSTLFNQAYYQAQLYYLFSKITDAKHQSDLFINNIKAVIATPTYKHAIFVDSLIQYRYSKATTDSSFVSRVKKNLKKIKRFSLYSPVEYEGKYYLVKALYQDLKQNSESAFYNFEKALLTMHKDNNFYDLGICSFEFYRFCYQQGFMEMSEQLLNKSIQYFDQWKAYAVTKHLKDQTSRDNDLSEWKHKRIDFEESNAELDLYSIIEGSQLISRELKLDDLIRNLLKTIIENAGAQRALLFIREGTGYFLKAEAKQNDELIDHNDIQIEDYSQVSKSVINYVIHSSKDIVLENAHYEGRFINDPYINKLKIKSLLCMKIKHKNEDIGILYLENISAKGAFDKQRIEILKIFCSQAAISIENAKYYNEIRSISNSYERFVPKEFLTHLGHARIQDIHLGTQAEKHMTVMFTDIRGFTSLSENTTAEGIITLLNELWNELTPSISRHHGLVDKFIGDSIMALFTRNAQDALNCAVEMQKTLSLFNKRRSSHGVQSINMGFGIHRGKMVLGTVGSHSRLSTTVIGDAVNVASRIEEFSKVLCNSIIVTSDIVNSLSSLESFNLRYLGNHKLRGLSRNIGIYEEYSNDPEDLKLLKKEYDLVFSQFIQTLERKDKELCKTAYLLYKDKVDNDELANIIYKKFVGQS